MEDSHQTPPAMPLLGLLTWLLSALAWPAAGPLMCVRNRFEQVLINLLHTSGALKINLVHFRAYAFGLLTDDSSPRSSKPRRQTGTCEKE